MSDDNIVSFPAMRELAVAPRERRVLPSRVLKDALGIEDEFQSCVIIGILKDGTIYAADTQEHFADTILLLERFRAVMLAGLDDHLVSDNPPGASA